MTSHADPGDTVIEAREVDVVRERRLLLAGISVTIRAGEHWALIGPNGAGKSTLLSVLGAYRHPTRGQVDILGQRLGRTDVFQLRRSIGRVTPQHPLRSALTAREVVLTGATGTIDLMPRWTPRPDELERADQLLYLLGLSASAETQWHLLSHGERGRALIARAVLARPPLLLLDEPATGLDLRAREQLLTSLDRIRDAAPEATSVLVTHHLEELPTTTTHALLLREGRTVGCGRVEKVLTTEMMSDCFDHPVSILRHAGRWAAVAAPDSAAPHFLTR
ncbi:ABC transporter ATP-binding protein [Micromonospora sp. NPDC050784]|uniref:ABC transporter ATP-binding protein n=1 Tax=Micromonospora sp. NPDC050784 TaxID=3364281 RepID=UPI0037B1C364